MLASTIENVINLVPIMRGLVYLVNTRFIFGHTIFNNWGSTSLFRACNPLDAEERKLVKSTFFGCESKTATPAAGAAETAVRLTVSGGGGIILNRFGFFYTM
ncbi:hypothetical protein [Paenibacillus sp. 1P07SE]|uniref:hypothetical protein n=1 Tax=Paenibacillus sp. 1P07SE TaxID=3132209 RepID=UPI0039A5E33F